MCINVHCWVKFKSIKSNVCKFESRSEKNFLFLGPQLRHFLELKGKNFTNITTFVKKKIKTVSNIFELFFYHLYIHIVLNYRYHKVCAYFENVFIFLSYVLTKF